MQLVTCAFPGTGKSTISKNAEQYGLKHCHVHFNEHTREYELTIPAGPGVPVFDSDSSVFDKNEFPGNYIKHIKEVLATCPEVVIFVSSHDNVRAALKEAGIEYQLGYPERELKADYIERYKQRGSSEFFVNLMDTKWNDFIDSCESDDGAKRHIILSEGEFLVDQLKDVLGQPSDIVPDDIVVEQKPELLDPVFPTAIISGNESIGDIVCDDVGRPVAAWGANGLEPLPEQSPDTSVVVTTDAFGLEVAPEAPPAVADPVVEGADIVATPDFSTAIVTGNESIGETVYSDIGVAVAVVGEDGLQPLPEVIPQQLNDVFNGEPAPLETPPPGVEVVPANVIAEVQAVPETPVPAVTDGPAGDVPSVLNLPEEMQAPTNIEIPQLDIVADNDEPQIALDPESGNVAVSTDVGVTVEVDPGAGTTEIKQGEDTVIVDNNVTTVAGNESSEENPTDLPQPAEVPPALADMDRLELLENFNTIEDDISVIESVVEVCQSDKRDGLEGAEDGGAIFTNAAADIKKRYGTDVEPTLAGFEGFLDSLKNAMSAIGEALKGKPNKEGLAKIKKYLIDSKAAISQYGSETWLSKQQFINVGKTKMQVPAAFAEVTDVDGVRGIIDVFIKAVDGKFKENYTNSLARQKAGLPIFNKFVKQKEADDAAAQLAKHLPIKPEDHPGIKPADIEGLLKVTLEKGELPVLRKEQVKDVVKMLQGILDVEVRWETDIEKLFAGPAYEDFYDSDFFDPIMDTKECTELINAVEWENATEDLQQANWSYAKVMLPVMKFLEMWILNSTK